MRMKEPETKKLTETEKDELMVEESKEFEKLTQFVEQNKEHFENYSDVSVKSLNRINMNPTEDIEIPLNRIKSCKTDVGEYRKKKKLMKRARKSGK